MRHPPDATPPLKKPIRQTFPHFAEALGPDHPDVAATRNNLGLVLRDLGNVAGARIQLLQALKIAKARLGTRHPTTLTIRRNLDQLGSPTGHRRSPRRRH
jgi:hypothetical protein